MKEYLSLLISVALFGGVIGMLSPEGDLKKYLRLLCSLCLLCAMLAPIFSEWRGGNLSLDFLWESEEGESIDYDEIYNQSLQSGNRENAEKIVKNRLLAEFDLPYDSLDVRVLFSLENDIYRAEKVELILHPQAIFADPKEMIALVNEVWECPCVVIYE